MRLSEGHIPAKEGTLRVQATNSRPRFEVTTDGTGVVGHAGAALLVELADRLGLTAALGWRAGRGQTPRHRHDAGAVLRDLAVVLADGGDALSDLAVLRDQGELFGSAASTATAWRVIERVAADELGLAGLRAARAQARGRAWQVGAGLDGLLLVDLALAQLLSAAHAQPIVVRADTGGATHALVDHLRQRGLRFSVSLPADERVRAAVLAVGQAAWRPAVDPDGQPRPGAEVAELHTLDLAGWPVGTPGDLPP
jgi:hypothetical protein